VSFASYGSMESTQISTSNGDSKPSYKSFRGGSNTVIERRRDSVADVSDNVEIRSSEDILVDESEDGGSLFSTG
jgi:hypothetical protein